MASKILSKEESEWAYKKWCMGYTLEEIGYALNVSHITVHRSFNGKPKVKPKLNYERDKE